MYRRPRVLSFHSEDPIGLRAPTHLRAALLHHRSTVLEETMSKEKAAARPLALSLVVLGTLSRLLPHPPNMTAVGAASLFSGARLRGWQALLVPLACMLVTDPILGFVYGFRPFSGVRRSSTRRSCSTSSWDAGWRRPHGRRASARLPCSEACNSSC